MRRVIGLTVTAASLLMSCFLPYSTYASLNHASLADMMSEQNSFDMAAAAPIDFVDLSLNLSTAANASTLKNCPAKVTVFRSGRPS